MGAWHKVGKNVDAPRENQNFIMIVILNSSSMPLSTWSRSSSSSPAGGNRDASARHGAHPWRGDEGIVQVRKYLIYLEGSFRWKNLYSRAKCCWAVRMIGQIHMFVHCDDNNDNMVRKLMWDVKKTDRSDKNAKSNKDLNWHVKTLLFQGHCDALWSLEQGQNSWLHWVHF